MMNTINIEPKLRPCLVSSLTVNGERQTDKALFHRWVEQKHNISIFAEDQVRAMVEMEDGTIKMVPPGLIKFLDPIHKDFDFGIERRD